MLKQTRNALIYSDLALFLMDTRDGITGNDVALYKWLTESEPDTDKSNKASNLKEGDEPKV